MNGSGVPRPSRLPLIVAAIVLPTTVAAVFGGPGLGALVAAAVLLVILVAVAGPRSGEPIEVAKEAEGDVRHILLAVSEPVDDPHSAEEIAHAARIESTIADTEILAVAPTQPSFLDRWASDVRASRTEAQRKLAITMASLSEEHLHARAEIGESNLVVAVEDALRSFPADEVILATGPPEEDRVGADAVDDLRDRLPVPFEHLVVSPPG